MDDIEDKLRSFVTVPNQGITLGLDRIERLLATLGNPQLRLPPIIHVAGTNGKGSTVAFMRAMCEAAGLRVHVFTSPHLVHFNERIRLAGVLVDDAMLLKTFEEIAAVNQDAPITYFEMITVAAFVLFAHVPADVVLLEVGLGGRLDATNVVTPAVSVITRISMDHMNFLGNTLQQIAGEKAGIMKLGVPCVVGYQADESVHAVFRARAVELGCPLHEYGRDFVTEELADGFLYQIGECTEKYPLPALLGAHQILNAANAITAVKLFAKVGDDPIRTGLRTVAWPGRLQQITTGPIAAMLPEGTALWYDGAHNDSGAEALTEQCRRWCAAGVEIHLIVGMLRTKDPAVFAPVLATAKSITAVTIPSEENAWCCNELAVVLGKSSDLPIHATTDISGAIRTIVSAEITSQALNKVLFQQHQKILLITGSLHLGVHLQQCRGGV